MAPVLPTFSLPARSTICNLPTFSEPSCKFFCSTVSMKTKCDLHPTGFYNTGTGYYENIADSSCHQLHQFKRTQPPLFHTSLHLLHTPLATHTHTRTLWIAIAQQATHQSTPFLLLLFPLLPSTVLAFISVDNLNSLWTDQT
eukprot:2562807-Amphidinium_carterae.1